MNESMKEAVFEKRPHLGHISKIFGELSLLDYAKKNIKESAFASLPPRKEVADTLSLLVTPILGRTVSAHVANYLKHYRYVSAVDHHGPLTLPSFVHGNIVQAQANKDLGESVVLVLSTGGVSLDNSSFPRGLTSHDASGQEVHLPILSLKHRHKSVFAVKAYAKKEIKKFLLKAAAILPGALFQKIYADKKVFSFLRYWEQVTRTNYFLFQLLPSFSKTDFVSVPIEIVTSKLLLKSHMKKSSELGRIFFDPVWRQAYLKASDGIAGAYTSATQKGTELFWRLKDGRREQLFVRGDTLRNEQGDFSVKLVPKAVAASLKKQEIFPSYALCLITTSFWGGLVCGGGYSQVDYLSELKDRYVEMLLQMGEKGSAEVLKRMPTDRLGSDYLFAFAKRASGTFPLTLLDIISGGNELSTLMHATTQSLPLRGAIDNVLPDVYGMLTHNHIPYTPHVQSLFWK